MLIADYLNRCRNCSAERVEVQSIFQDERLTVFRLTARYGLYDNFPILVQNKDYKTFTRELLGEGKWQGEESGGIFYFKPGTITMDGLELFENSRPSFVLELHTNRNPLPGYVDLKDRPDKNLRAMIESMESLVRIMKGSYYCLPRSVGCDALNGNKEIVKRGNWVKINSRNWSLH